MARWPTDALASSVARVLAAIPAAINRIRRSLARACRAAANPSVGGPRENSAASTVRSVAKSYAMILDTASVQ